MEKIIEALPAGAVFKWSETVDWTSRSTGKVYKDGGIRFCYTLDGKDFVATIPAAFPGRKKYAVPAHA